LLLIAVILYYIAYRVNSDFMAKGATGGNRSSFTGADVCFAEISLDKTVVHGMIKTVMHHYRR
jgi:hypothetical protein